jgi:hypothetical protein
MPNLRPEKWETLRLPKELPGGEVPWICEGGIPKNVCRNEGCTANNPKQSIENMKGQEDTRSILIFFQVPTSNSIK